jgi:hypothetical protein
MFEVLGLAKRPPNLHQNSAWQRKDRNVPPPYLEGPPLPLPPTRYGRTATFGVSFPHQLVQRTRGTHEV